MTFEEVNDDFGNKHIILDLGNGNFKSFPADESNPEYKVWAIAEGIIEADEDATTTEPEIAEETPAPIQIEP